MKSFKIYIIASAVLAQVFVIGIANGHQRSWPGKRLAETLPAGKKFVQRQSSLSPTQIHIIESSTQAKVGVEDKNPIVYQATDAKSEKLGTIIFVDGTGPNGTIELGVAVDDKGQILHVVLFDNSESSSISGESFLSQFIGKSSSAKFKVGEDVKAPSGDDKAAQSVANAVKRADAILVAVLGIK